MDSSDPSALQSLDVAVRARLAEMERLVGSVAHQLGATMLPSLKEDPAMAEHRAWNRLAFHAEAMKSHIVGQKQALDFLRGARRGDLDAMAAQRWTEWVVPLLEGLAVHGEAPTMEFDLEGTVSPPFSRALVVLLMALDGQALPACTIKVTGQEGTGIAEVRHGLAGPATGVLLPPVVVEAWRANGAFTTDRSSDGITLRVEFDH